MQLNFKNDVKWICELQKPVEYQLGLIWERTGSTFYQLSFSWVWLVTSDIQSRSPGKKVSWDYSNTISCQQTRPYSPQEEAWSRWDSSLLSSPLLLCLCCSFKEVLHSDATAETLQSPTVLSTALPCWFHGGICTWVLTASTSKASVQLMFVLSCNADKCFSVQILCTERRVALCVCLP